MSLKNFVIVITTWQVVCAVALALCGHTIGWLVHSAYTGLFGDVQESFTAYSRVSTYVMIFTVSAIATAVGVTLLTVFERRRLSIRQLLATFIAWHAACLAALVISEESGLYWAFHRVDWALFRPPDNLYSLRNVMLPRVIAWVVSSSMAIITVLWLRSKVAPVQTTPPLSKPNRSAVADENPYKAPQETDKQRRRVYHHRPLRTLLMIALVFAAVAIVYRVSFMYALRSP